MASFWKWLTGRVHKSPNAWAIVGGVYLIVLPPIFACYVALAERDQSNQAILPRLFLAWWRMVLGSSWFWLAYTAVVAIGMGAIFVGMMRAFQPRK
jgi:hypothetical protein